MLEGAVKTPASFEKNAKQIIANFQSQNIFSYRRVGSSVLANRARAKPLSSNPSTFLGKVKLFCALCVLCSESFK